MRRSSRPAGRGVVGPISSRNWTDLGAEPDRSRAGTGPISVRNPTDLGEGGGGPVAHPLAGL